MTPGTENTPGPSGPGLSLWFVIPAWKRPELSAVCFEQIARASAVIEGFGVDVTCLVVADDENLDIAEQLGFRTLQRPNKLGRKLNDGYQLAIAEGADYVCPLGSDSWIEPRRFEPLPKMGQLLCTRNYTVINKQGTKRAQLNVAYRGGVGSRVIPAAMLRECGNRPLPDDLMRGADTKTLAKIEESHTVEFVYSELHPMEVVGFQSDVQLNRYAQLKQAFFVSEKKHDPFAGLEEYYDLDLVERVKALYHPALVEAA